MFHLATDIPQTLPLANLPKLTALNRLYQAVFSCNLHGLDKRSAKQEEEKDGRVIYHCIKINFKKGESLMGK